MPNRGEHVILQSGFAWNEHHSNSKWFGLTFAFPSETAANGSQCGSTWMFYRVCIEGEGGQIHV